MSIEEILKSEDKASHLALFQFTIDEPTHNIVLKFNLWARYFFPKFFEHDDAPFHKLMDTHLCDTYKGDLRSFTNIAFRGSAKTTRTKLFIGFVILNDISNWRKFIKVLTKDSGNSKQFVTDIYNLFVDPRIKEYYPDTFEKTDSKREETMSSFTTSQGIKLLAGTVGTEQRGQIQDASRPDFIIFDDIETRKTLRSAVETKAIWDNMEEARTGLSKNGSSVYLCNYLSERGNVHKLVQKESPSNVVMVTPIVKEGNIAWRIYTQEQLGQIEFEADDWSGEYLCKPSASFDIMFDRELLDNMEARTPIDVKSGFKMYYEFDPSHRYGSGHDVSAGVGLDSSTSVFIDFQTIPARVVGTFVSNNIAPDVFADEIERETSYFGGDACINGIEKNNHGIATIARGRQLGLNLFKTQGKVTKINKPALTEYGWHTNTATKPKMIFDLIKAVEQGQLLLSDKDLIQEAKSYTRDDMMDKELDPRLVTRHYDLLIACAIAWQMKDYAKSKEKKTYVKPIPQPVNNPAL